MKIIHFGRQAFMHYSMAFATVLIPPQLFLLLSFSIQWQLSFLYLLTRKLLKGYIYVYFQRSFYELDLALTFHLEDFFRVLYAKGTKRDPNTKPTPSVCLSVFCNSCTYLGSRKPNGGSRTKSSRTKE